MDRVFEVSADLRTTLPLLRLANARHGPESEHPGADEKRTGPHDHLKTPAGAARYLRAQRLALPVPAGVPTARQLADLRALADAASAQFERPGHDGMARARRVVQRARFGYRRGELSPIGTGWDAFVAGLVPQLFAFERLRKSLKRCANPRCRWLFPDTSRNRSRVWCEMASCGSRAKMRRYRRRARRRATAR